MSCKALVSGFNWYRGLGYTIYNPNPSELIAKLLNNIEISTCIVKGIVLNVDYEEIFKLNNILNEYKPDIVIGLGLHPRTSDPLIELSAVNLKRIQYGEEVIYERLFVDEKTVVSIPINYLELYKYLRSRGYNVFLSNTLGLFLCNAVAYTYYKYGWEYGAKAVFLHIPPVGDLKIRLGLSIESRWSIRLLAELVRDIIEFLVKK